MEAILTKLIGLIDNFYLATYIIAGSALCIGLDLVGSSIFSDNVWINIGICYFSGMVASRISSLIIEPLCKKCRLIIWEPYEKYLSAENKDNAGKLISMSKVSGSYCTMTSICLILFIVELVEFFSNLNMLKTFVYNELIILGSFFLFLFSYRKQNHHGSIHNLTTRLIERINPHCAYISASGSESHPAVEIVEELKNNGVRVYSTHHNGTLLQRHGTKRRFGWRHASPL